MCRLGVGGARGCRRSGPWPTFPFQAWNSHILPHCGRRWGGMMPWLLTLLYAQNSPSRTPGKERSSLPFIIPNTFHRFSWMHSPVLRKMYSSITHAATSEICCAILKKKKKSEFIKQIWPVNGPEILQCWDSKFQGRYFALQQHPGVPLPDESEK